MKCLRVALILGAALLAGCVTGSDGEAPAPVPVGVERIAEREAELAALDSFTVSGGFGYWDDTQNLTADLRWEQSGEVLDIGLRAPLGLGRLDLQQTGQGARVTRSGRAPLTGPDAAALLQAALGLAAPVPLAELALWIRGLPGESARGLTRDDRGRLATLTFVDGAGNRWRARIRRYRSVDGTDLPALLTAISGDRHLKLALSDWTLDRNGQPASQPPPSSPPRRLTLPGA